MVQINYMQWRDLVCGKTNTSHLCGNTECLEPSHFLPETPSSNKNRTRCQTAMEPVCRCRPEHLQPEDAFVECITQRKMSQHSKLEHAGVYYSADFFKCPQCTYTVEGYHLNDFYPVSWDLLAQTEAAH